MVKELCGVYFFRVRNSLSSFLPSCFCSWKTTENIPFHSILLHQTCTSGTRLDTGTNSCRCKQPPSPQDRVFWPNTPARPDSTGCKCAFVIPAQRNSCEYFSAHTELPMCIVPSGTALCVMKKLKKNNLQYWRKGRACGCRIQKNGQMSFPRNKQIKKHMVQGPFQSNS